MKNYLTKVTSGINIQYLAWHVSVCNKFKYILKKLFHYNEHNYELFFLNSNFDSYSENLWKTEETAELCV